MQGDNGNDVLIGASNDTLKGGGGSDTFVFNQSFGTLFADLAYVSETKAEP